MADASYKTFPNTFISRGVTARYTDDTVPQGTYLNLGNCEEQSENAMSTRLGTRIINRIGTVVLPLGNPVHSLSKLLGLNNAAWRYAGSGTLLYRREGTSQGPYTNIANGMSGNAWSSGVYRPTQSSYPYLFIADSARMLKDNGSFATPQQWGIFAPNQPVTAQAREPEMITWNNFTNAFANNYVNFNSPTTTVPVSTSLTSFVTGGQINVVTPSSMTNINAGQLLSMGVGGEIVYVLSTTTTTFTAFFQFSHAPGTPIGWGALNGGVSTSTTASITYPTMPALGNFPSGVKTQPDDYININIFLDNPNNLQQINLLFDVGDGSFTQDYFIKSFLPALDQALISGTETATQAAVNQVFADALGITNASPTNPSYLNTGNNTYNFMRVKLQDFAAVGQADPNGVNFNWSDVNSMQIQVITNTNGPVNVSFNNIFLSGGSGPDSFAGVAYDYLYTYYNAETGAESNPSIPMSAVIPLTGTTYFPPRYPLPRRQPVHLTLVASTDPQVTNIRIYRRGGTLSANYLRLDQIPAASTSYIDISPDADISTSAPVSLVNDVPVTSTLPVPANTTLLVPLNPALPGAVMTVTPASMANLFVNQQVTLGGIADPNQEVVIVMATTGANFTAFVQNPHLAGDPVTAEAVYGQPCNLMAIAYNAAWLAGDKNNPHYLYYSTNFSPEAFGSPNFIEVGIPSDPITAIVPFQGSLFVATRDHWYAIGPATGAAPTVYPTSAVHGVYAPFGWVATESEIWHQSIDGLRSFAGGASNYRSQEIEFVFQGGETPIPLAPLATRSQSTMAYRDNMVFLAYVGDGGVYHRLIYHTIYKRFRNDDVRASCMFWESDTNLLLYGDALGNIHQDRTGVFDEGMSGGNTLITIPIIVNVQTSFMDQGQPKNQKNYNELTIDANTGGQAIQLALAFNDGEFTQIIGTLNTTTRQKVNFNLNGGKGYQAYRVSLLMTGGATSKVTFYQADLRGVELSETRLSFDTYWLKFGTDDSKLAKQFYLEYTSTSTLSISVYYDGAATPGFTTTMESAPQRISTWVRLPAVKFRLYRMIVTSTADFMVWPDSKVEVKPICLTKGYSTMDLMP